METISSFKQLIRRGAFLVVFLICWSGFSVLMSAQEKPPGNTEIPAADFLSRAKGIIRALYPGLAPPPRMMVIDERELYDPGVLNVFRVELCDISLERLDAGEPCPCPNPVLKATLGFDLWSKDKALADIILTGPAPRGRQDKFEYTMRSHTQWSKAQVVQALDDAGAEYGAGKKEQAIKALPLRELRPYMGELKVESARFHVTDPQDWKIEGKLWGGCAWLIPITATGRSGHKHRYIFVLEPFEGRVISIWTMLHPTSPDFPSFPPAELKRQ